MRMRRPGHVPGLLAWGLLLVLSCGAAWGQDAAGLLQILAAPGGVGLMRHARAPGTGDPAGFQAGQCSTQRNLDDTGRAQARALGQRLQAAGLAGAGVFASSWCRTMETAALLGLAPVSILPALDSVFAGQGDAGQQTAALRAVLEGGRAGPPRVMVTHQVNITALTGLFPAEAEMIVLRPGAAGYEFAGRLGGSP